VVEAEAAERRHEKTQEMTEAHGTPLSNCGVPVGHADPRVLPVSVPAPPEVPPAGRIGCTESAQEPASFTHTCSRSDEWLAVWAASALLAEGSLP
jgi:hypothetical protein